ncbi:hypothetical protein FQR65_LT18706 [Abscondita terminalis]|nr:hypothetical protein FQR65_LT18706 [Abscondita terminalis]
MYALVKFLEDNIYYVCNTSSVKISNKNNVQAKWADGRFYAAKVIVQHVDKFLLNELRQNLESNLPVVELPSDVHNSHYLQVDTNVVCNLTNNLLEPDNVLNTDASEQCNFELNYELPVDIEEITTGKLNTAEVYNVTDVQIEFFDEPIQDYLGLESDSPCDLISNVSIVNEDPQVNEIECRTEDRTLQNLNNIDCLENVEIDVNFESFNRDNTHLLEENQHLSRSNDDTATENNHNDSIVTQKQQKKRQTMKPYNREVVVTPAFTGRTLQNDSAVVSSSSDKKRRYFCIYCKQLYAKFPQHLQISHSNQPAVKMFMKLPPRNPERKKIIETIRRRGDFQHNVSLEYNSGELLVARRSHSDFLRTGKDYLPCPFCAAYFRKDTLRIHAKNCTPKTSKDDRTVRVLSRTLLSEIHPRASDILKNKIFPVLRDDDCVHIIRYDVLTILFGNHLSSKYSSQHHHDMIRNKLRSIGRLLIAAKHYDSTVNDFSTLLTPEKFDVCVAAIKDVGGLNSNNTSFKAPTTVLTLSTICKQAAEVWKSECIKMNDPLGKQRTEDFLTLFKVTFPAELANTAIENRVQQQRQKVVELPLKDDIQKLVAFLRHNRREWFVTVRNQTSNLQYAVQQLASFTLVSLMVFNRRRPGELERITIKDFSVLKFADSALNLSGHLKNSQELNLAKKYKRFEIRGKLNRTVPVLVDFEIESCINLIIEKREQAGISAENPYVFACFSVDHRHKYLRAYFLLRKYAHLCGAKNPNLLRATQLRKHIATECALNDLADNEIRDVANFMGHAIDIHNNIYRRPVAKRDIIQMSQILEKIQGDYSHPTDENPSDVNFKDASNSSSFTNETSLVTDQNASVGQTSKESIESEIDDVSSDSDYEDHMSIKKKKREHVKGLKRVCGFKTPWKMHEQKIVIDVFGEYINQSRIPTMEDILEKLPSLNDLKRSPTSVRAWIHNEVKRRRNSSTHEKPGPKTRWTDSMKMELKNVFRDHFEDNTLPSNAECAIAIENCSEYQHLTVAALKTAVANEQKRMIKTETNSIQLRRILQKSP